MNNRSPTADNGVAGIICGGATNGLRELSDQREASVVAGDLLLRAQGFAVGRPPTASHTPQSE